MLNDAGTPAPATFAMVTRYVWSASGLVYEASLTTKTIVLSPNPAASGSSVAAIGPDGPCTDTVAAAKLAPGKENDQRLDMAGRFW